MRWNVLRSAQFQGPRDAYSAMFHHFVCTNKLGQNWPLQYIRRSKSRFWKANYSKANCCWLARAAAGYGIWAADSSLDGGRCRASLYGQSIIRAGQEPRGRLEVSNAPLILFVFIAT
jgi:hypothetical protein